MRFCPESKILRLLTEPHPGFKHPSSRLFSTHSTAQEGASLAVGFVFFFRFFCQAGRSYHFQCCHKSLGRSVWFIKKPYIVGTVQGFYEWDVEKTNKNYLEPQWPLSKTRRKKLQPKQWSFGLQLYNICKWCSFGCCPGKGRFYLAIRRNTTSTWALWRGAWSKRWEAPHYWAVKKEVGKITATLIAFVLGSQLPLFPYNIGIIGDVINPIVGVYMPIIRIHSLLKVGWPSPIQGV